MKTPTRIGNLKGLNGFTDGTLSIASASADSQNGQQKQTSDIKTESEEGGDHQLKNNEEHFGTTSMHDMELDSESALNSTLDSDTFAHKNILRRRAKIYYVCSKT